MGVYAAAVTGIRVGFLVDLARGKSEELIVVGAQVGLRVDKATGDLEGIIP